MNSIKFTAGISPTHTQCSTLLFSEHVTLVIQQTILSYLVFLSLRWITGCYKNSNVNFRSKFETESC